MCANTWIMAIQLFYLLFMFTCLISKGVPNSRLHPPSNFVVSALNLNISLNWDPPINVEVHENILYTVFRGENYMRQNIPHCINITNTWCNLGSFFTDINDINRIEVFTVSAQSTTDTGRKSHKIRSFHPHEGTIGAPVLHSNMTITQSSITVTIHGAATPFVNHKLNRSFYVGEDKLGNVLGLEQILFSAKLWKVSNNKMLLKTERDPAVLKNGFATIKFENLHPATTYMVQLREWKGLPTYKNIPDIHLNITTLELPPPIGPTISTMETISRSCDQRDVKISWSTLSTQDNHGVVTTFDVRVRSRGHSGVWKTSLVSASQDSIVVHGLGRWKAYDAMVIANNKAGGTGGTLETILQETPDDLNYRPQNPTFSPSNDVQEEPSWYVRWDQPPHYHECIQGYHFHCALNDAELKDVIVEGVNNTSVIVDLSQPGNYVMEITPIIIDGANHSQSEITLAYLYKSKESSSILFTRILTGAISVVVLLIVVMAIVLKMTVCYNSIDMDMANSNTLRKAKEFPLGYVRLRPPPEKEYFDDLRANSRTTTDNISLYGTKSLSNESESDDTKHNTTITATATAIILPGSKVDQKRHSPQKDTETAINGSLVTENTNINSITDGHATDNSAQQEHCLNKIKQFYVTCERRNAEFRVENCPSNDFCNTKSWKSSCSSTLTSSDVDYLPHGFDQTRVFEPTTDSFYYSKLSDISSHSAGPLKAEDCCCDQINCSSDGTLQRCQEAHNTDIMTMISSCNGHTMITM